jgi:hypothetical protein
MYSRTSDVSIFMCSGGVRWILVMFDVMTRLLGWILICWIVMCMLYFLLLCMCCIFYCYVCAAFSICQIFETPQSGRQTK